MVNSVSALNKILSHNSSKIIYGRIKLPENKPNFTAITDQQTYIYLQEFEHDKVLKLGEYLNTLADL